MASEISTAEAEFIPLFKALQVHELSASDNSTNGLKFLLSMAVETGLFLNFPLDILDEAAVAAIFISESETEIADDEEYQRSTCTGTWHLMVRTMV